MSPKERDQDMASEMLVSLRKRKPPVKHDHAGDAGTLSAAVSYAIIKLEVTLEMDHDHEISDHVRARIMDTIRNLNDALHETRTGTHV
jgi:hypothetical protein